MVKRWSTSTEGPDGRSVAVEESAGPGTNLRLRWGYDPDRNGPAYLTRYVTDDNGQRFGVRGEDGVTVDPKRKARALRALAEFVEGDLAEEIRGVPGDLKEPGTIGWALDQYVRDHIEGAGKSEGYVRRSRNRAEAWARYLASEDVYYVTDLKPKDFTGFAQARQAGRIDNRGRPQEGEAERNRAKVSANTAGEDQRWFRAALKWARANGEIEANPIEITSGSPWQYAESDDARYQPILKTKVWAEIRAKADDVLMAVRLPDEVVQLQDGPGGVRQDFPSYLPELMDLTLDTGHRIGQVVQLRLHDLRLTNESRPRGWPDDEPWYGLIRFPGATAKTGKGSKSMLTAEGRKAADRALTRLGLWEQMREWGYVDGEPTDTRERVEGLLPVDEPVQPHQWLFPQPNPRSGKRSHLPEDTAGDWWRKAAELAGYRPDKYPDGTTTATEQEGAPDMPTYNRIGRHPKGVRGASFHALRRQVANDLKKLARDGVDPDTAARMAGWADAQTMQQVYVKVSEEDLANGFAALRKLRSGS